MEKSTVVCFGEVLWDNLLTGRQTGGAPLNVCYHLSKQEIGNVIISKVGKDLNGVELISSILDLGINSEYIQKTDLAATSTVEVEVANDNSIAYEIVENVAWDYIEVDDGAIDLITSATYFIYGSLAARNNVTRNTLLTYLNHAKWPVFDINLRPPFFEKELTLHLISKCKTLKLNKDEILVIGEWFNIESNELKVVHHLLTQNENLHEIIITKGAEGVSYYSRMEEIHLPAKSIIVQDTVGSGDSFLATFLANKIKHKPIETCLSEAIKLSAFIATKKGATPKYELTEIDDFFKN